MAIERNNRDPKLKVAFRKLCGLALLILTASVSLYAANMYHYRDDVQLDISKVPFSRYGSYIAFSHLRRSEGEPAALYMRTLHGGINHREVFRVEVLHGRNPVPFKEIATPTLLRLQAADGEVEICMSDPKVVRVRGNGVGLRLEALEPAREYAYAETYMFALEVDPKHYEVNNFSQLAKFLVSSLQGDLVVDAPWLGTRAQQVVVDFLPDADSGKFEGAVEEFKSVLLPHSFPEGFDTAHQALKNEYQEWLKKMPDVSEEFGPAADLAAYVNWESVVAPEGHLKRPTMFMSKNWMTNVWSWDHCFNAMALIYKDPKSAWDQFMVLMANQDPEGAFPDLMNDQYGEWNFSKPPIHGWALAWMLKQNPSISREQLGQVYGPLSRWTEWYLKYRDDDHDGIPQYNHGNDSGWDNATVFLLGPGVESPDLAAYLVVQMDVLADVARRLGKPAEADNWKKRADDLNSKLIAQLWRSDHFVALLTGNHKVSTTGSLILYLPAILGNRLPAEIRSDLLKGLTEKGRFLTPHGLASESLRSPFYRSDGYWLGPIWAPSTMVMVEGLEALGEKSLARDLRVRFCRLVAKSGMAENFDAITGEGLRDPAYTWTSSVFLIMAHDLSTGGSLP